MLVVTIAVGAVAVGLSLRQARELALRAPLAARPFAQALSARLAHGDLEQAVTLCRSLRPAWAAEAASRTLEAQLHGEDAAFALEEARGEARMAAERHLYAIRTLGRLSVPLALGCAIVELSLGFQSNGREAIGVGSVQAALDAALRVFATGFTSAVFCQASVAILQRQATARLDEMRMVANALTSQMTRTSR